MKFEFKVVETIEKNVSVEAENYDEAYQRLEKMMAAGEIDMARFDNYSCDYKLLDD